MTAIEFERANELLQFYGGLRAITRDVFTLKHASHLQESATKKFYGLANANHAGIDEATRGSILNGLVGSALIYSKLATDHPVYQNDQVRNGAAQVLIMSGRIAHKFSQYELAVYCRVAAAGFFDILGQTTDASFARVHAADSSMYAHRDECVGKFDHASQLLAEANVVHSSNPALQADYLDISDRLRDESTPSDIVLAQITTSLNKPTIQIPPSRLVDRRQYGLQAINDEWYAHGSAVLCAVASSYAAGADYKSASQTCDESSRQLKNFKPELREAFSSAAERYRGEFKKQTGSDVRF